MFHGHLRSMCILLLWDGMPCTVRSDWPVVFVQVSASLVSSLWLFLTCSLHAPSACPVPSLFHPRWYFFIDHILEFFCLYLFVFIHICMQALFSGSTIYWKIVSVGAPWKPLLVHLELVESFPLALDLKATFSVVLFSWPKRMNSGLISSLFILYLPHLPVLYFESSPDYQDSKTGVGPLESHLLAALLLTFSHEFVAAPDCGAHLCGWGVHPVMWGWGSRSGGGREVMAPWI